MPGPVPPLPGCLPVARGEFPPVTSTHPTLSERAHWPPVLDPEDLAVALGLASERAAREFLLKNGVPHVRVGGRVYVLTDVLLDWLRERQERHPTKEEARARADQTIRAIAPPSHQKRRGRKPPTPRRD